MGIFNTRAVKIIEMVIGKVKDFVMVITNAFGKVLFATIAAFMMAIVIIIAVPMVIIDSILKLISGGNDGKV